MHRSSRPATPSRCERVEPDEGEQALAGPERFGLAGEGLHADGVEGLRGGVEGELTKARVRRTSRGSSVSDREPVGGASR